MSDKIKLVRFMGHLEYIRYVKGATLRNHTNWAREGSKTNAVGFCFFPLTEAPEKMMRALLGIATLERVVIVETDAGNVRRAKGRYRDPDKDDEFLETTPISEILKNPQKNIAMKNKTEYCATEYNKYDFQPVRTGIVTDIAAGKIRWTWAAGLQAMMK